MATKEELINRIINDFPDNKKLKVKPFRTFFADLVEMIYDLPGSSLDDYEEFRKLVFGVLGDPELQEKLKSPSILDFIMSGIKVKYHNLPTGESINDYITGLGTQDYYDKYFTVEPGELAIFRFKIKSIGSNIYNGEEIYIFKGGTGNFGIKGTDDDPDRVLQLIYTDDFFKLNRELYITERIQPIIMGDNTLDQYVESMDSMGFESILDALENLKEGSGAGKFTKAWQVQQPGNPNQANGLNVNIGDSIEDFLISVFRKATPPTYVMPTASLAPTPIAREVGETIELNLIGTFNQNDAGSFTARRIYKNGSLFQSGNTATDTITLLLNTTTSYSFQVDYNQGPIKNNSLGIPDPTGRIQQGTVSSGNLEFKGTLKNFFGAAAPNITNFRTLPEWNWSLNNFNIDTGTTLKDFYIVIPSYKSLTKVFDASISTEITAAFGTATIVNVLDASGTTTQQYKLYKYPAGVPYDTSHQFQITIG